MRRILVTDAQDRCGPAAVRCLAAGGYRVTATATTRMGPGLWSRGCSFRRILPDPRISVEGFIAQLEHLVREVPHNALLPGRDETLYAVSKERRRLAPFIEMGLPPHEVVERALNKLCLAAEAEKVGLAPPEGRVCHGTDEALDAAREFGLPVVVKPVRVIAEVAGRLDRYPSRLVTTEAALRDAQQAIGSCIVQRREAGHVISFGGVATDSGLLGSVVSRYRRTWPPIVGSASFSETIVPPGALTEQVEAVVAGIGWRGLFQLQLIERHDGVIEAIDFNPRPYGSMGLARAAGVPLTTLWCASLLGEHPKRVSARPGVPYRFEAGEILHVLWRLRRGEYRGAAKAMLPRRGVAHAYFQARDPLPILPHGASFLRQLAQILWGLCSRRLDRRSRW